MITPAPAPRSSFFLSLKGLTRHMNLGFTFGFFGIIILMVMPIAPILMDLLLALTIGIAFFVLLVVIYVKDPAEFSIFPTLLLAVTLLRLGLNVASTRLILLDGFAGHIVDAFGNFMVRGNYVVGSVVFCILVVINFVVITKGAGRIAEVAARFTLDALPGKQMSIDAELNAGLIDEKTAKSRRVQLQKEADFYGAMDGASKFVRGDAIAGILITLINVAGGIGIGIFQKNLSLSAALQKYALLSIGDGLVTQIPALIVSVAAGILITRSAEGTDLSEHMGQQITRYPKALSLAGAMLLLFSLLPRMPTFPFLLLAVMALVGVRLLENPDQAQTEGALADGKPGPGGPSRENKGQPADKDSGMGPTIQTLKEAVQPDRFAIEVGYGLLNLVDPAKGGDLLERITTARKKLARDLGLMLPNIAVKDSIELESTAYRFLLRDKIVGQGDLKPGQWMAIDTGQVRRPITGTATREPVFNLEAIWVDSAKRREAESLGYTLIDAGSVLMTHLNETIKRSLHLLLEREDVQRLIDVVKEKNPTLVSELLPDLASVGLIQRVLQNLIKEQIPIRNLTLILEAIADFAPVTKNPDDLSEQARRRLAVYFVEKLCTQPNHLDVIVVDTQLEQQLVGRIHRTQFEAGLIMDPELTVHLVDALKPLMEKFQSQDLPPVLVTSSELRLPLRRFLEPSFPKLSLLAYSELPSDIQIQAIGSLS